MSFSERITSLLEQGVLVSPEMLKEEMNSENPILQKNVESVLLNKRIEIKKPPSENDKINNQEGTVKVIYNYDKKSKKRSFDDFVKLFNLRFKALERLIKQRPEMQGLTSISKLKYKEEKEKVSIIGMINKKTLTKNNNIILTVEDLSGQTAVLIHKNNADIHIIGKDLVLDEVIGIVGVVGKNIVFSNSIVFPDVSLNKELKKSPEESYVVFISDVEVGSKVFLESEFKKFIEWINGRTGTEEQRRMANLTKYLVICGDLVAGVGVYPGQEDDLIVKDIKTQYNIFTDYMLQINPKIKIVICAGNHDAGRIEEPQPPLYNDFAQSLWKIPNAIMLSNPSMINIGSDKDFSGLDILLYHGYSLIYYANNVESIRNAGGQKRVDLIMKFLLQKRHLAPTHQANMYIPDSEDDPLVIDKVPDVFVTGHVHRASATLYRNINLLNTSCWGAVTEDQEKRGLEPQPARVFVMNLQTRKVKIINFLGK